MTHTVALRAAFVTLTGLDEWTPLDAVAALARDYPVEWGILFHPDRQGAGRYPPLAAIEAALALDLKFSAHLCGKYARSVTGGKPLPGEVMGLLKGFGRLQVNVNERGTDTARVAAFAKRFGARAILQCRGLERFPRDTNVDWLFDTSGGRGLLPDAWPVPEADHGLVGYSGGIGPDTVASVLEGIGRTHPGGVPFWLDMEGAIRTEDRLDLGKCREVCEQVFRVPPAV